ncbi:MAG: putative metal-binding protein (TIGR02443 family) [Bermanella sp.]|jgi:uncharacterized metal-binding protein (TIGR02443 family)
MSTQYGPRRFIASAVCPKCAEMDKTVMYRINETEQVRECVRCGFNETIRDDDAPAEPKTRVNQPRIGEEALAHEDEVQVVKLMDPGGGSKRRDH